MALLLHEVNKISTAMNRMKSRRLNINDYPCVTEAFKMIWRKAQQQQQQKPNKTKILYLSLKKRREIISRVS